MPYKIYRAKETATMYPLNMTPKNAVPQNIFFAFFNIFFYISSFDLKAVFAKMRQTKLTIQGIIINKRVKL